MMLLRCALTIVSFSIIVTAKLNAISGGLKAGAELDHRDLSTLPKATHTVGISLPFHSSEFRIDSPTGFSNSPPTQQVSGSDTPSDMPSDMPSGYPSSTILTSSFRHEGDSLSTNQMVDSFYAVNRRFDDFDISESGFIPPDPHGAAGLDMLVAVINSNISGRDKFGTLLFKKKLKQFFADGLKRDLTKGFAFDPKILYDAHRDRFVVVTLFADFDSTKSFIFLAVSKDGFPETAAPRDWNFGAIDSRIGDDFADYPSIAVCKEAIYVTNNMFSFDSDASGGVRLWIVAKDPFYNFGYVEQPRGSPFNLNVGNCICVDGECLDCSFTSQPAAMTGATGAYLLSFSVLGIYDEDTNNAMVSIIHVKDPLGTPSFDHQFVDIGQLEDLADIKDFLPDAPQPNSEKLIGTNDKRMLDAVLINDTLWGVFTVTLAGKATAYWVKLDTSNSHDIKFLDKGPIEVDNISPGASTFYPSIAINKDGIVAFGFAASGKHLFVSAYVTVRDDAKDPKSTVRDSQVASPGKSFYLLDYGTGYIRWGDYTGMVVDPVDGNCFWAYNEYAAGPETWTTAWARLCTKKGEKKSKKSKKGDSKFLKGTSKTQSKKMKGTDHATESTSKKGGKMRRR